MTGTHEETDTVTISRKEYESLQETIRRQEDEIQGLECRVKKLLEA